MTDRTAKKVNGVFTGKDIDAFENTLIDMKIRGTERSEVQTVTMSTLYCRCEGFHTTSGSYLRSLPY
jgi:hypothetical protein